MLDTLEGGEERTLLESTPLADGSYGEVGKLLAGSHALEFLYTIVSDKIIEGG